jgi:hypothetical protein
VRIQEHDLDALDPAFLLQSAPVLDALVEDLESLRLPARDRRAPSDEESSFRHRDLLNALGANLTHRGNRVQNDPLSRGAPQ